MTMDLNRLYEILSETTVQLRKGEVLEGTPELVEQVKSGKSGDELSGGGVLEVYAMPHIDEAREDLAKIDCHFLVIGVDTEKAKAIRDELIGILKEYPNDRLQQGPSYIEVGAQIGDQGAAFQLFALGEALGIWKVVTPESLGFSGDEARQMAGSGFIMISGFFPDPKYPTDLGSPDPFSKDYEGH